MVKISKAVFDEDTVNQLIELSKIWEKEDITNGLRSNTREDLLEPCFVAKDGSKIVGYIFGEYVEQSRKVGYIERGDKCFYVSEVYVLKEYRSQGIGRQLFTAIEEEIKGKAQFLTLSTSTKDYEKILSFYTKCVNMDFHDAFLIKKL